MMKQMIKVLKKISVVKVVLTMLSAVLFTGYAYSQKPVDASMKGELVDSISSLYEDWSTVSISGKLKMEGRRRCARPS